MGPLATLIAQRFITVWALERDDVLVTGHRRLSRPEHPACRQEGTMDLGLEGKRAVISGSTAGIGLAIAKALAHEGAAVVINGRSQRRVDEALNVVGGVSTATVRGVAADLGTAEGCAKLLREAPDADGLVKNLGILGANLSPRSVTTTGDASST